MKICLKSDCVSRLVSTPPKLYLSDFFPCAIPIFAERFSSLQSSYHQHNIPLLTTAALYNSRMFVVARFQDCFWGALLPTLHPAILTSLYLLATTTACFCHQPIVRFSCAIFCHAILYLTTPNCVCPITLERAPSPIIFFSISPVHVFLGGFLSLISYTSRLSILALSLLRQPRGVLICCSPCPPPYCTSSVQPTSVSDLLQREHHYWTWYQ